MTATKRWCIALGRASIWYLYLYYASLSTTIDDDYLFVLRNIKIPSKARYICIETILSNLYLEYCTIVTGRIKVVLCFTFWKPKSFEKRLHFFVSLKYASLLIFYIDNNMPIPSMIKVGCPPFNGKYNCFFFISNTAEITFAKR